MITVIFIHDNYDQYIVFLTLYLPRSSRLGRCCCSSGCFWRPRHRNRRCDSSCRPAERLKLQDTARSSCSSEINNKIRLFESFSPTIPSSPLVALYFSKAISHREIRRTGCWEDSKTRRPRGVYPAIACQEWGVAALETSSRDRRGKSRRGKSRNRIRRSGRWEHARGN